MTRSSPRSTLFPYTTLFRSIVRLRVEQSDRAPSGEARGVGGVFAAVADRDEEAERDRKSTRLNSSHMSISYAVFCLKKKKLLEFLLYLYHQCLASIRRRIAA